MSTRMQPTRTLTRDEFSAIKPELRYDSDKSSIIVGQAYYSTIQSNCSFESDGVKAPGKSATDKGAYINDVTGAVFILTDSGANEYVLETRFALPKGRRQKADFRALMESTDTRQQVMGYALVMEAIAKGESVSPELQNRAINFFVDNESAYTPQAATIKANSKEERFQNAVSLYEKGNAQQKQHATEELLSLARDGMVGKPHKTHFHRDGDAALFFLLSEGGANERQAAFDLLLEIATSVASMSLSAALLLFEWGGEKEKMAAAEALAAIAQSEKAHHMHDWGISFSFWAANALLGDVDPFYRFRSLGPGTYKNFAPYQEVALNVLVSLAQSDNGDSLKAAQKLLERTSNAELFYSDFSQFQAQRDAVLEVLVQKGRGNFSYAQLLFYHGNAEQQHLALDYLLEFVNFEISKSFPDTELIFKSLNLVHANGDPAQKTKSWSLMVRMATELKNEKAVDHILKHSTDADECYLMIQTAIKKWNDGGFWEHWLYPQMNLGYFSPIEKVKTRLSTTRDQLNRDYSYDQDGMIVKRLNQITNPELAVAVAQKYLDSTLGSHEQIEEFIIKNQESCGDLVLK